MTITATSVELPSGRTTTVYRGGEGPALLWLHGIGGVELDLPFLEILAATGRSVHAPVCPGFTDLADLTDILDLGDLVLHYDDVLRALGVSPAIVAGHSFGAMVGAELAAHYPDVAERLVLVSPLGLWNDDYPVADLFATPNGDLPDLLFADPQSPPARAFAAHLTEGTETEMRVRLAQALTTVARFLFPIPERGLVRRLRRISAPTLIVVGEDDHFVPARYATDFADGIASAEVASVPGAAHMVPHEAPDTLIGLIEGFIGAAGPVSSATSG